MIFKINILFLVSHRCYTTNTRFNSNGDANTNYLDLHYEACGLEELIESIRLVIDHSNQKIHYNYTCRKTPCSCNHTIEFFPASNTGYVNAMFLHRQVVQCSNDDLIKDSQLTTSPTVKKIGYKYRCCDSLGNTNLCYNGSGFTKLQLFGNGLDQYKYSVRLAKLFTRSAKKGKKQL